MASRGVNKVILVGNLGNDPEIRHMPNGNEVANLTVATSESWNDKQSGEKKEQTEWHRVVIFGKLAEIAGEYLRKGSQVYLEGKLQTRKWQDKDGADRYTTEVVVNPMGGVCRCWEASRMVVIKVSSVVVIRINSVVIHHNNRKLIRDPMSHRWISMTTSPSDAKKMPLIEGLKVWSVMVQEEYYHHTSNKVKNVLRYHLCVINCR